MYDPLLKVVVVNVYAPLDTVAVPRLVLPFLIVTVPSGTFLPYLSFTVLLTFTLPAVLLFTVIVVVVGILATLIVSSLFAGLYVLLPG